MLLTSAVSNVNVNTIQNSHTNYTVGLVCLLLLDWTLMRLSGSIDTLKKDPLANQTSGEKCSCLSPEN